MLALQNPPKAATAPAAPTRVQRSPAHAGPAQPVLAVDGLPAELSDLSVGMLYSVAVDSQSIRVALAAQSLSSSAHARAPSVLITTHEPLALVKKARNFAPQLENQLGDGSARILRLEADISRRLLRFGSAKLIDDLKAQGIAPRSLVVIDLANKVLGLGDPATAAVTSQLFQAWAESDELTILFLVQNDKENPREYATLKTVAEQWGGLAVVKSNPARAVLIFKHWYGAKGLTPGGRFAMGISDKGQLGVTTDTARSGSEEQTTIGQTREDNALIATSIALQGLGDFASRAQSCDDPLELMDFARRVRGGTVLLHFSERKELDRLIKLVSNLRSITAPEVRIVIRECGASLRRTENHALLQLGASFVVPKDVPPESAKVLIEQLGTAALKRMHNPRAAEQLSEILADSTGRLLTPYDFRMRVSNLLDLSDIGLPHTLVILGTPVAGLATRIASLISPRIRDVMFTDVQGRLLLFLFGCDSDAAEIVMNRLFVTRTADKRSWRCTSDAEEIRALLLQIDTESNASARTAAPAEKSSMIRGTSPQRNNKAGPRN